jgi:hypothetical protein
LKDLIGYGKSPTNAEEALHQENERSAFKQVSEKVEKIYDAEESTLGVVPGMTSFFEYGR